MPCWFDSSCCSSLEHWVVIWDSARTTRVASDAKVMESLIHINESSLCVLLNQTSDNNAPFSASKTFLSTTRPVVRMSFLTSSNHWFRLSYVVNWAQVCLTAIFVAAWRASGSSFCAFRQTDSTLKALACGVPIIEAPIKRLMSLPLSLPSPTWQTLEWVATSQETCFEFWALDLSFLLGYIQRGHPLLPDTRCYAPSALYHHDRIQC